MDLKRPAKTNNDSTRDEEEKTIVYCVDKSKKGVWPIVVVEHT